MYSRSVVLFASLPARRAIASFVLAALLAATSAVAQSPCGIFVSTTGTDVVGNGLTESTPVRTIAFAQSRALSLGLGCLFVRAGTYSGVIDLAPGLHIRGGFDASWQPGPVTDPEHQVTITGGFFASENQYLTMRAVNLSAPSRISEIRIVAPAAVGTASGAARASHGVVIRNSTVEFANVIIVGGNGANGPVGSPGQNASQTPPASAGTGGNSSSFFSTCNTTSRGARGAAGANPCTGASTTGGEGGLGGTMDTDCGSLGSCVLGGNCNATPGGSGANGARATGAFGGGGLGGSGGSACGTPDNGEPGLEAHGVGGPGGLAGNSGIVGNYWMTATGATGSLGDNGGGGGGGGGSGGCDLGSTDSYGAGGGGGGAGGCRAPTAGAGGSGGGASIGILAINSLVTLVNVTIQRGSGGSGGSGGGAGRGQPGGAGGAGGLAAGSGAAGGRGGDGGDGGNSGAGGGGAGGNSVGVLRQGGTLTSTNTTFSGGAAGSGGTGGVGLGGPTSGGNGSAGQVLGVSVVSEPNTIAETLAMPASVAGGFPDCLPAACFADAPGAAAHVTALLGATPNPVRDRASVRFTLERESDARVELLDVRGAIVRTLASGPHAAGPHTVTFSPRAGDRPLEPGIYFVRLVAPAFESVRRAIVVR